MNSGEVQRFKFKIADSEIRPHTTNISYFPAKGDIEQEVLCNLL
jgi:hypothetical protein